MSVECVDLGSARIDARGFKKYSKSGGDTARTI